MKKGTSSSDLSLDMNISITNTNEGQTEDFMDTNLKRAYEHWKESGVGQKSTQRSKAHGLSDLSKKEPYSLKYVFKLWQYPPGLNSSMTTYLDLNFRLLILVSFLVFGNVLLMYQAKAGYCKYLFHQVEGVECGQNFSIYSYLVYNPIFYIISQNSQQKQIDFFNSIRLGIILSIWTLWILPFLYLLVLKRHLEFGLKIKYNNQVKRVENFSLMLTDFRDPQDLKRDFEADFQSLIQENGFTGECKIIKSVYSTDRVKVQILEEEAETIAEEISSMRQIFDKYSEINSFESSIKQLSKKIEKNEKKLVQVRKKIRKNHEKAKRSYLLGTCVYFVTLSSSLSRDKILRSFKDKYSNQRFCSFFRFSCIKQPKYRIAEAPDPSNIKWVNFGIPRFTLFCFRFLSYVVLLLLLFFILILLNAFNSYMKILLAFLADDSTNSKFKLGSALSFYLTYEIVQYCSTFATQIVCMIFDIDFNKSELIFSQGMSLGVLKVLTLIAFQKILVLDSDYHAIYSIAVLVVGFKVVLTQSVMKPIMKVSNSSNVLSFIKMSWIRLKFALGSRPLLTQKELNSIFTKPKCYLQNLYCEDIYISSVAFLSSVYNPGVSFACLVYFLVKTIADRFLFLRFYAELEIDSIELSLHYLKLFRFLIRLTTLLSTFREYYYDYSFDWNTDKSIFIVLKICRFISLASVLFPFEFLINYICKKAERTHLESRTEASKQSLRVDEDDLLIDLYGGKTTLDPAYYKGVIDLDSITKADPSLDPQI